MTFHIPREPHSLGEIPPIKGKVFMSGKRVIDSLVQSSLCLMWEKMGEVMLKDTFLQLSLKVILN